MKKLTEISLTIAVVLLAPSLCWANAIFTLGNNPQPNEQNVLLNMGSTGNTVTGTTNTTGTTVVFTSTQTLTEPANGQARIEATNGTSQIGLTNVDFNLNGTTFTDAIFNMDVTGTIGVSGGTATITAVTNDGTFNFMTTLGNGSNFLTVTTSGGEVLESISISYSDALGFTDLRQVRISGVPDGGTTLSLLGASLLGLGLVRRKLSRA